MYLHQLQPRKRVATAPHTDAWMSGERYGTITVVGRKWVHVRGERSGRNFKFAIRGVGGFSPKVDGLQQALPRDI